MHRSSSVVPRCVLALAAGAALLGQAASAGTVVLSNLLPVDASCILELHRDPSADPVGANTANLHPWLQGMTLSSGSHAIVFLNDGLLRAEIRFDAYGKPFTASSQFGVLGLFCQVGPIGGGGPQHGSMFNNPSPQVLGNVGRLPPPGAGPLQGIHTLHTYTPTDRTDFMLRLRPANPAATAADLWAGAPLVVDLSAMPLLYGGDPAQDQPVNLGRYNLVSPAANPGIFNVQAFNAAMGNPPIINAPVGNAPVGNAPVGNAPVGNAPAGNAPVGNAPVGNAPAGNAPVGNAPVGNAPVGNAPADGAQVGNAPVANAPVGDAPVAETPVRKASAIEPPYGDSLFADSPFGKAPRRDSPFSDSPFLDAPFGNAPFDEEAMVVAPFDNVPEADALVVEALFGNAPFGNAPFGSAPFGNAPVADARVVDSAFGNASFSNVPVANAPVGGRPSGDAIDIDALLANAPRDGAHDASADGSSDASHWFAEQLAELQNPASKH